MTVVRTNDILNGTSGNDTFNPGLGDDQVYGSSGDDLLILDYSIDDTGTGISLDAAYSFYGGEGYAYRYTATNNTVFLDRIYFKDINRFAITGTSKDDYINPWNGNDTINALTVDPFNECHRKRTLFTKENAYFFHSRSFCLCFELPVLTKFIRKGLKKQKLF